MATGLGIAVPCHRTATQCAAYPCHAGMKRERERERELGLLGLLHDNVMSNIGVRGGGGGYANKICTLLMKSHQAASREPLPHRL